MKTLLIILMLPALVTLGCNGNRSLKENKSNTGDKAIDYRANGFTDLNGSEDMKDILCQCWEYREDAEDIALADQTTGLDLVYRGYCLFDDGSLVKDPRGDIQAGNWSINMQAKPITLKFYYNNGNIDSCQLAYLTPGELKLVKHIEGKQMVIELISNAFRNRNNSDAPFHISNNSWRIKPAKPETDEQLKLRLKNCIHFYILFYDEHIRSKADKISFNGLPSCFKWYGGGIYMQKKKDLPEQWVNSFYSKDQAMKAYGYAEKLVGFKYKWPKNESNWLKLNLAVLKQMENKIDSL